MVSQSRGARAYVRAVQPWRDVRTGRGVPQDDVEAYKWLNFSTTYADASQQEEFAEMRDAAAERLTPQQRAEGQKLSRKWFAAHPRNFRPS